MTLVNSIENPYSYDLQTLKNCQKEIQGFEQELRMFFERTLAFDPEKIAPEQLFNIEHVNQKLSEASQKADALAIELKKASDPEVQNTAQTYLTYRIQTQKYVSADVKLTAQLLHIKDLEEQIAALFSRCITDRGALLSKEPLGEIEALQGRFSDAITRLKNEHPLHQQLESLNFAILDQIIQIKQPTLDSTPSPRFDKDNMQGNLQRLQNLSKENENRSTFFMRMIDAQFVRVDIDKDGNCCLWAILKFLRNLTVPNLQDLYSSWTSHKEEIDCVNALRRSVADHMNAQKDFFAPVCSISPKDGKSNVSFEQYLHELRETGHYFDNPEIKALADLLRIKIYVYAGAETIKVVDNKIVPLEDWAYSPLDIAPDEQLPEIHLLNEQDAKHWWLLYPKPLRPVAPQTNTSRS